MRAGLKGKVVILVSCLVAATIAAGAAIMLWTERREREVQLMEQGRLFARLTATDVARSYGSMPWGAGDAMDARMISFFGYYPDLTRIMVISRSGGVLYDSAAGSPAGGPAGTPGAPGVLDEPGLAGRLGAEGMDARVFRDKNGEKFMDILAPVTESGGPQFLKVRYIISYRSMEERLSAIRDRFILLAGFFMLAGLAAAVFFSGRLTGPLMRLKAGAGEIERGNLGHVVEVGTKDEIGELAGSFNLMARALKEHRQKLEAANDSLVKANEELTELQAELVRSERMAAVGELAAGLSHEIDNPVGVILGFAELMLEETPEGDPRREDLATIVEESKRCRRIVRGLLDFSRPAVLGVVPTDVGEVITRTVEAARSQRLFKRVRFEMDLEDTPEIPADPDRIGQVFMNLILNAAQAMPEGGQIFVQCASGAGSDIVITVADQGPGITPEDMDKVFEPFYTTKRPGEGTGLGLAICRRLLHEHGGEITAESGPEGGAVFTVRLPAGRESSVAQGAARETEGV